LLAELALPFFEGHPFGAYGVAEAGRGDVSGFMLSFRGFAFGFHIYWGIGW
jgi:hypothetical protein